MAGEKAYIIEMERNLHYEQKVVHINVNNVNYNGVSGEYNSGMRAGEKITIFLIL